MLLDTTPRPVPENIAITVASPPTTPAASPIAEKAAPVEERLAEPAPVRPDAEPVEPPTKPAEPPARTATPAEPKPLPQATAPERPEPPPAATPAKSKFVVQVAALSSAGAADELVARLSLGGFSAYAEAVGTAGGTLHRVRVGPYGSRDDAQRAIDRLKAAGHKASLVGG
jgi:DedD protein